MYNPHLNECGSCLVPFTDKQEVYPHFEDYLCVTCTPDHVQETRKSLIWRELDEKGDIKNP